MYVSSFKVRHVRGITELKLPHEGSTLPLHTVFIGANSTCKTSILRALAIGLCNRAAASALLAELPGNLVTAGKKEATISVELRSADDPLPSIRIETKVRTASRRERRIELSRREVIALPWGEDQASKTYYRNGKPCKEEEIDWDSIFVCAYGVARGIPATESWTRYRIVDSVYSLFRYDQPLQNPELVLHRVRDFGEGADTEMVEGRLLQAIGLSRRHRLQLTKAGILVKGPSIGTWTPFEAIADGYRASFNWVSDLIGWALTAELRGFLGGDFAGIVLLDEIDQHLHPELQTKVLGRLKRSFPRLQIIATTHSPSVALSTDRGELVPLVRSRGRVSSVRDLPNYANYSAEDMLVDPKLFNAPAYSESAKKRLKEYERLASLPRAERSASQVRRLRVLATELGGLESESREDSEMLRQLTKLRHELGL